MTNSPHQFSRSHGTWHPQWTRTLQRSCRNLPHSVPGRFPDLEVSVNVNEEYYEYRSILCLFDMSMCFIETFSNISYINLELPAKLYTSLVVRYFHDIQTHFSGQFLAPGGPVVLVLGIASQSRPQCINGDRAIDACEKKKKAVRPVENLSGWWCQTINKKHVVTLLCRNTTNQLLSVIPQGWTWEVRKYGCVKFTDVATRKGQQ